MSYTRGRKGFRRAGVVRPDQLGLPQPTARQLHLGWAWRQVAGAALARRAPALRMHRGILEIQLPEGPWAQALRDLLPKLAGRLAAAHPDLGLRKFRLVPEGRTATPHPALDFPPAEAAPSRAAAPAAKTDPRPDPEPSAEAPPTARLLELERAYLGRVRGREPSP